MKLLDTLKKNILLEVSEKVKKQLLTRYRDLENVTDDEKTIIYYIDEFEKYKGGLPADKRDLTNKNFKYDELKNFIDSKIKAKTSEQTFTEYKKKAKSIGDKISNDTELKIIIRKFFEIRDRLAEGKSPEQAEKIKNIFNYKFLKLVELMEKYYPKIIKEIIKNKFKGDAPENALEAYADDYLDFYPDIPFTTKGVNDMTWTDFEHLVDEIRASKGGNLERSSTEDVNKIEKIYDDRNLLIYQPKTKNECITLRNGRTWCTSASGSHNLYYNYRFKENLTLYYVIDEDLDFDDLNYAVVILVQKDGRMRLADKSNRDEFSGHRVVPWETIVSKVPKLEGLKNLFVPIPMSEKEQEIFRKYQGVSISSDKRIQNKYSEDSDIEMWLEVNSPRLSDFQYENLPTDLQKKYIALGFDLTPAQIDSSTTDTIKYYITKKIELLKGKSLNDFTPEDIRLLNKPELAKLKQSLKSKFGKALAGIEGKVIKLDINDRDSRNNAGKFIELYGFIDIFDAIPSDIDSLMIQNEGSAKLAYDVPESIGKLTTADSIYLANCIKSLPDSIANCQKVTFLSFPNNPELKEIPWDAIHRLPILGFLNLENSKNIIFPDNFNEYWFTDEDVSSGFYVRNRKRK